MSVCCLTQLLAPYSAPVRALAVYLVDLIRVTAPDAVEAVRLRQRCVRYSHQRCGYFCGLYPQVSSVQLLFEYGVLLPDPDDVLRGEGPYVRFVAVRPHEPLHTQALVQLIAAPYNLPRRRADRIALADAMAARPGHGALFVQPQLQNG